MRRNRGDGGLRLLLATEAFPLVFFLVVALFLVVDRVEGGVDD